MELIIVYIIGSVFVLLIGPQRLVAIYAGYKQGGIVRDPVPAVVSKGEVILPTFGQFMFLSPNDTRSPITTHTPGNCDACGSQEFRTHQGVAICSYCRSVG